jgi:uncharacterized protein
MIFICDVMLGKLARYLRMLGLDAPYIQQGKDAATHAAGGEFIIFTKKTSQAGYPGVILVHSNDPHEQLEEIKDHVHPYINESEFMARCIECNVHLVDANKDDIEPLVPEYIYHHHHIFKICPSCGKVYWQGSHTDEMNLLISNFVNP